MSDSGNDEQNPLTDDEFILRRIHKNHYRPGQTSPILRPAFEPHSQDDDGLSFHRECFISASELAFTGRKRGEYYIARFSVSVLRGPDYRLTIDPAPDPDPAEPRGHCVIRELSVHHHQTNEKQSKLLERRLALLASKDIVYVPVGSER